MSTKGNLLYIRVYNNPQRSLVEDDILYYSMVMVQVEASHEPRLIRAKLRADLQTKEGVLRTGGSQSVLSPYGSLVNPRASQSHRCHSIISYSNV